MADRHYRLYTLLVILLLSLFVRIAYYENTVIDAPVRGDAVHYLQYAKNLINHATFSKQAGSKSPVPDAYWAPGYPAFLAAVILAAETLHVHAYPLIMGLQILLGALTAVLTFLIARLFMGRSWALLPALFVSLSPHLISLGDNLLTETLYGFFLAASLYVFLLAFRNKSTVQYAAAGVLFGLTWLVNPVMFFVPVFFIPAAVVLYRRSDGAVPGSAVQGMACCLALFLTIAAAWQIRGMLNVPHDAPSGRERLLENLVIGSHSDYYRIWRADPRDKNNPADLDMAKIGGSYAAFAAMLSGRIIRDPLHYLKWYFLDKPLLLWSWNIQVGQGDVYVFPVMQSLYKNSMLAIASYSIMRALHYWLFGLAVLGLMFLFRGTTTDNAMPVFLYISLVYISSVYVISQAGPRYSVPLRSELYLCAAFALSRIAGYLNRKRLQAA